MAGSVGQPTLGAFPWVASKANTNWSTRENVTSRLGMGRFNSSGAQNDLVNWDIYRDSVTWKFALIHDKDTIAGIYHVRIDGSDVGTTDGYAASAANNTYSELTGLANAVAGVDTFELKMASKNASATNYYGTIESWAWIATSGTYSTPAGTDTPGYTHELLPWMGTKTNTGWSTRTQSSAGLGGGRLDTNSTTQNDFFTYDIWAETRTYKLALVAPYGASFGIHNFTGVSGTQIIDAYTAGETQNNYAEVTGIVATSGVKTVQDQMATKNASSTGYRGQVHSIKWISPGA